MRKRGTGTGSVGRIIGSPYWYIWYYSGKQHVRESTKTTDKVAAEKLLRKRILEIALQDSTRVVDTGKALRFTRGELELLRGACVYQWNKRGRPLYVGAGKTGGRPLSLAHHRRIVFDEADEMLLYPCQSREAAAELEAYLIKKKRPLYNRGG